MYETNEIKMYAAVRCDDSDRKKVEPLMDLLREEGIAVDFAENLNMSNTAAAIVFFSQAAIDNGSARRHYGSAKKGGALIVPVVLDKSDPLSHSELNRLLGRKEIVYASGLKNAALIRKIVYMLPTSVKYNKPEEEEVEEKEIPTGVAVGTCPDEENPLGQRGCQVSARGRHRGGEPKSRGRKGLPGPPEAGSGKAGLAHHRRGEEGALAVRV